MIMSFIVSVIMLIDDRESLFAIEKRTTNVCGAIRKKCAVEPGNRVRTINHIKIFVHAFIPSSKTFCLEGLPKAVNRVLVERPSNSSIWPNRGGLIIYSR